MVQGVGTTLKIILMDNISHSEHGFSSNIQVAIKATAARRIITAGPGLSDTDAWAVLPDGPLGIGGWDR